MFPRELQHHVGPFIDRAVDWLLLNYGGVFDAVSGALLRLLLQIEAFLRALPWWLVIGAVGVAAWLLLRRWTSALVLMALLFMIGVFGLWPLATETMAIIITSVVLALVVGIPAGIL
ncbi:MAG TPA: hypothetical protein VIK93_08965, partial [Limnochordales bacterium]